MTHCASVYIATNTVNGHTYVGVTRFTPEYRWMQHVGKAKKGCHTYLHRAIAKHGAERFMVEEVAACVSLKHIGDIERAIIQRLKPVYNQTNGGEVTRGRRGGPDVYARIAAKNTGLKRTPEQNAANSAQAKARYASNSIYRAIAVEALRRGRENVDQEKRKSAVSASARARVWSAESRAKLSASCIGRRQTQESIAKNRAKHQKSVRCVELDMVFSSVSEAATFCGLSISGVSAVARGRRNSANGYTYTFVTH